MLDLRTLRAALGGEISAGCLLCPGPGHSQADRSLSVKIDASAPDGFLVHSFAGDDPIICKDYVRKKSGQPAFKPNGGNGPRRASDDDIATALMAAVQSRNDNKPKGRPVATFNYTDADGTLLYQVLKYDNPRTYKQRQPNGHGGYIWNLDGARRVLYRWPELLKYPSATVFICEGEKDADRVASLGHCATTIASGKWTNDCVKALTGRNVIILQDNDPPGVKRATEAAQQLHGAAVSIRVVLLPDLPPKGDVSDWLDADPRNAERFVDICFDTPEWKPNDTDNTDNTNTASATDNNTAKEESEPAEEEPAKSSNDNKPKMPPLPFINMSNWDNEPVPQYDWAVPRLIPLHQTGIFSGDGGLGKSTMGLQLVAAHSLGRGWLRFLPEPRPAFYIDAEDSSKVMQIRLWDIRSHYETTFAEMVQGGLKLLSWTGEDAVLAAPSGKGGKIEPTNRYRQLLERMGDVKPIMTVIASTANVFAGQENDRAQVQQFIGLTTRLAIVANGSVLLVNHPSLSGMSSDSGSSGSTQWHNSVRCRFYLKRITPEKGEQPDDSLRELDFKKVQYSELPERMLLQRRNGLYLPMDGVSNIDRVARQAKAKDVFLTLLGRYSKANRNVSDKAGTSYAPALFAREDEAKAAGLNSKDLEIAMRDLFKEDRIWNEPYGRPSRPSYRIVQRG